ncbi:MAG: DUF937 domain-containing protein [Hyphomicrobiaceae bacterium]
MTSIVSAISSLLTPEIVGKLAAASGLDSYAAQSAVSAAVPSILSGLADIAATPAGARQLASAVAEQPASMLASITSSLAGSAQVAEKGAGLLASLLGGGALAQLATAVSKFAGIGEGPTRTVLGLLAPLVLGVLGREQRVAALDTNGLARLLLGQKEQFAAALPAGFKSLLVVGRTYEGPGATALPETHDTPRALHDSPRMAPTQRPVGASAVQPQRATWPYWVLPLLALGGLLWYLLPSGHQTIDPVAISADKPTYLATVPDNWASIGTSPNDYVNRDIHDRAGQKLGTIRDMLVGPDGKMAAAVVGVGQFLGIGDKDVAVPFASLHVEQRDAGGRIVMDATKDTLQAAPAFDRRLAPKR